MGVSDRASLIAAFKAGVIDHHALKAVTSQITRSNAPALQQ